MTARATFAAHVHVEGFEQFHRDSFDKRKVRVAMRKAGRRVEYRAKLNISLASAGSNYPRVLRGVLRDSIKTRVSRSGFLVKVMPDKTTAMAEYYPAYLHYGVKQGGRFKSTGGKRRAKGERQALIAARKQGTWRIAPRDNYIADALEDEASGIRADLSAGFRRALG